MTPDTPGHSPDDAPAPPASTRWTEDPVQDDDALPAPFVPGRDAAARRSVPSGPSGPATEPPVPEPPISESPVHEAEDATEEGWAFPFESREGAEAGETGTGAPAQPDRDRTESGMGWTPADLGTQAAPQPAEPARPDPWLAEVAEMLERMARLLREEGLEAVRREMDAPDRLTALVAGLIAGNVSGRS